MIHNVSCPICKKMLQPANNPNILMCGQKRVFVGELDTQLDTTHATYGINDDGQVLFRVIEVPPYIFEIHENPERGFYQTRIQKISSQDRARRGRKILQRETLLVLPGVISCLWHDEKAVFDKIKMLMLFS